MVDSLDPPLITLHHTEETTETTKKHPWMWLRQGQHIMELTAATNKGEVKLQVTIKVRRCVKMLVTHKQEDGLQEGRDLIATEDGFQS